MPIGWKSFQSLRFAFQSHHAERLGMRPKRSLGTCKNTTLIQRLTKAVELKPGRALASLKIREWRLFGMLVLSSASVFDFLYVEINIFIQQSNSTATIVNVNRSELVRKALCTTLTLYFCNRHLRLHLPCLVSNFQG